MSNSYSLKPSSKFLRLSTVSIFFVFLTATQQIAAQAQLIRTQSTDLVSRRDDGRHQRGDQPPPQPPPPVQPQPFVTSLSSTSHITVIRAKPRPLEIIYTTLDNVTVSQTAIKFDWTLIADATANVISPRKRKRRGRSPRRLQWTVTLREFGNFSRRGKSVRDELTIHSLINKTYSLTFNHLNPGKDYEICLTSNDGPINDDIPTIYSSSKTADCNERQTNFVLCKEVHTLRPHFDQDLAIATAVSSASTLVVVLICCCCCPTRRKNSDKGGNSPQNRPLYQRFSKSSATSSEVTSSDNMSTYYSTTHRPSGATQGSKSTDGVEYYINPTDALSISRRNLRLFVRESRRLYIPPKWSTDQNKSGLRQLSENSLKRPKSWPHAEQGNNWPGIGASGGVNSASSASIL